MNEAALIDLSNKHKKILCPLTPLADHSMPDFTQAERLGAYFRLRLWDKHHIQYAICDQCRLRLLAPLLTYDRQKKYYVHSQLSADLYEALERIENIREYIKNTIPDLAQDNALQIFYQDISTLRYFETSYDKDKDGKSVSIYSRSFPS